MSLEPDISGNDPVQSLGTLLFPAAGSPATLAWVFTSTEIFETPKSVLSKF